MVLKGTSPNELKASPGADFAIDGQQVITEWSEAAAALLGIPSSDAIGHPCYSVVNGKHKQRGYVCRPGCPAFSRMGLGGLSAGCSLTIGDGAATSRRFRCELHALPRGEGGALGQLSEEVAADLAVAPVSASARPEPPTDILHALTAFASLSTSLEPDQLESSLERALDLLRMATGADSAEIFLAEPDGHDLLLTVYRGPFWRAFCQRSRFSVGQGLPGLVLERGEPVVSADLSFDQRFLRDEIKHKGFHGYVSVPLRVAQKVIGVLCIASRDEDFDTGDALRLLTWSSVPIAITVHAGLLQASRLGLEGAVDAPAENRDLDSLLLAVLRQARDLAGADAGTITLFGDNGDGSIRRFSDAAESAVVRSCSDTAPAADGCPALEGGHGVALWGARREWPLACQRAPHLGRTTCCVPIRRGDEHMGLIQLVYRDTAPVPPTRHLGVLLEFAAHAATVLSLVRGSAGLREPVMAVPATFTEPAPRELAHPSVNGHNAPGTPFLRIWCLGPFEIERNGSLLAPQVFKRRKALALLKILVLHAGTPIAKETLIEWLWPESDPDTGLNRLHGIVHALREVIEPIASGGAWKFIHFDGDHYLFDPLEPCWTDLATFKAAVVAGQCSRDAGDFAAAFTAYDDAVRLYRGDLFEEDRFAEWALLDREHLKETYLSVLQRIATHHAENGDRERAIGSYRQIVREDPLREVVQRQLIESLWRSGRRDEALQQYERFALQLRRELDVPPLPETEALVRSIRRACMA